MKIKYASLLALVVLIVGFKVSGPEGRQVIVATNQLQGTWELVSEKHGDGASMNAPQYGHFKKKMIAGKHYSWAEYNKEGTLLSMGGGTYTLVGNTYTENIEYFYPSGSGLLGATIPFECKVEEDSWHHAGFIQVREIDGETGEYVVTETEKLSEVWKRIK